MIEALIFQSIVVVVHDIAFAGPEDSMTEASMTKENMI
jgi:hypothetical protein